MTDKVLARVNGHQSWVDTPLPAPLVPIVEALETDGTLPVEVIPVEVVHNHVWGETPSGQVTGSNATFTLAAAPSPAASLLLFKNGLLQRSGAGNDFTLAGAVISFVLGNLPQSGDDLVASYTT